MPIARMLRVADFARVELLMISRDLQEGGGQH